MKATETDITISQFQVAEWAFPGAVEGNPYDCIATATFTHGESGETRQSALFFDENSTWKLRFNGSRWGEWTWITCSEEPDLNGHKGRVRVTADPEAIGFVTHIGNRWARNRGDRFEAFLPQLVMYHSPDGYHEDPERIESHIDLFLRDHGFTGFHTQVYCRWFDIGSSRSADLPADPNPDPRTFEALELLIRKTHAAGGVVHIWAWGDESRKQTPVRWGINGEADRRLQRYLAARLGPLPGWTMGYGYDLWEWVDGEQVAAWHNNMQNLLGWSHMLGARGRKHSLALLTEEISYASYEQHRPDYAVYVRTLERRVDKPAFSEDRFRIRSQSRWAGKDYDEVRTRRGLWQSTMAGGVANIWGNLLYDPNSRPEDYNLSAPYRHPEWVATWRHFFRNRFTLDLVRRNEITNGVALGNPGNTCFLVYREEANAIWLDLSTMPQPATAFAVDTARSYDEVPVGPLSGADVVWRAPHYSDWAIVIESGP